MADRWGVDGRSMGGRWQIDGGLMADRWGVDGRSMGGGGSMADRWGGGGGVDGWGVDGRSMAVLWGVDGRSTEPRQRDLPDTTVYKTRTGSISIPGAFFVAQVKLHLVKLHLFTLLVKLHLLALLVRLQTQNLK